MKAVHYLNQFFAGLGGEDKAETPPTRLDGAVGQLRRILGDAPDGLGRATELLELAGTGLRPEGRPLYAGVLALGMSGRPANVAHATESPDGAPPARRRA